VLARQPISLDKPQQSANVSLKNVSEGGFSVVPLQDADVKEITTRLDVIIKLGAALFAREFNNIDAIVKLEKMQLSREQIANALGITTANVAQQLYMAGKRAEKKPQKKEEAVAVEVSTEAPATPAEEA
jgi:hypothetical protein